MMTNEERDAVENLIKTLENAAQLIDIMSRTLMTVLDGGGRALLPSETAAELDAQVGDAGVQSTAFLTLARLSRESFRGH